MDIFYVYIFQRVIIYFGNTVFYKISQNINVYYFSKIVYPPNVSTWDGVARSDHPNRIIHNFFALLTKKYNLCYSYNAIYTCTGLKDQHLSHFS